LPHAAADGVRGVLGTASGLFQLSHDGRRAPAAQLILNLLGARMEGHR
jgi:hypothetical protein